MSPTWLLVYCKSFVLFVNCNDLFPFRSLRIELLSQAAAKSAARVKQVAPWPKPEEKDEAAAEREGQPKVVLIQPGNVLIAQ